MSVLVGSVAVSLRPRRRLVMISRVRCACHQEERSIRSIEFLAMTPDRGLGSRRLTNRSEITSRFRLGTLRDPENPRSHAPASERSWCRSAACACQSGKLFPTRSSRAHRPGPYVPACSTPSAVSCPLVSGLMPALDRGVSAREDDSARGAGGIASFIVVAATASSSAWV